MGSNDGESDEKPMRQVNLSTFWIGKYEVTQSEWQSVMGSNPATGYGVGADYPVYNVSWYAILKYCNLRSMAEGLTPVYSISGSTNPANWGNVPTSNNSTWNAATCNWSANGYRLPTEAEWEYAARGGNQSQNYPYSGSNTIGNVAWHYNNSYAMGSSHPNYGTNNVGTKASNELGIYDMSGNVWEWCWDWYGTYPVTLQTNPVGADSGHYRVFRGGSWVNYANGCSVSYRNFDFATYSFNYLGFRCVRVSP